MSKSFEPAADIASSTNYFIRHFNVTKAKASEPLQDVKGGSWQIAASNTVPGFSAVGYYFSRELQKAMKVPVAVIHTSWGGSPAEVWMSQKTLESNPDYKQNILDAYPEQLKKAEAAIARYDKAREEAKAANKPAPTAQRPRLPWKPAELYNGMVAPLIPYTIKGAIWYQGEANAGRAWQYRTLYTDMIRNWRKDWNQGDFTFICVQLAPFDHNLKRTIAEITASPTNSSWAELRESQWLSTKTLKSCGMAVITDVGEKDDIHPTRKAPVGARLALQARKIAYGEKIVAAGPEYKSMKIKKNTIVLSFDNVGSGLEARGGELTGFSICDASGKFVWAKAEIIDNTVIVSSPLVISPVAVRFGWADFPVVNLFNKEGLPATPFRTDEFPGITQPKGITK